VSIRDLNFALSIFSAMLTPVILISATGSLTISTSNRLSRAIDRARKITELISMEKLTGLVSHDSAASEAVLWAGTRIEDAGKALIDVGLAMHNTGDIDQQFIGGAGGARHAGHLHAHAPEAAASLQAAPL
jgi:FAD/FMN-containing dehydrogenase